jgi:hypothetical protein
MDVRKAASLMGRKSVESRKSKWGKKEFKRKLQAWGKLGGRPRKKKAQPKGSGKKKHKRGER